MRSDLRSALVVAALLALPACEGPQTQVGKPAAGSEAARTERVVTRLREYVYATYDVDLDRSETSIEKLKKARDQLADSMTTAGLSPGDGALGAVVGTIRDYLRTHGDFLFVPLGSEAAGVLLVRVADRREENGRAIGGASVTYRALEYSDAPIEDFESYRRRLAKAPPARPVARAAGKTIYIDRGVAKRIAADVVIPRTAAAKALEQKAAAGEALTPVDTKDLLRHRALADAIAQGEDAVARAIAVEEETRLAAMLALSPADPAAMEDAATATRVERLATLAAAAVGDPRYHLASAIAATIAVPGTPPAEGARGALAVFGKKPLHVWTVDELREKARNAH